MCPDNANVSPISVDVPIPIAGTIYAYRMPRSAQRAGKRGNVVVGGRSADINTANSTADPTRKTIITAQGGAS